MKDRLSILKIISRDTVTCRVFSALWPVLPADSSWRGTLFILYTLLRGLHKNPDCCPDDYLPFLNSSRNEAFNCKYCKNTASISFFVLDHVVPIKNGGKDELSNLQAICHRCNSAKGDKLESDFLKIPLPWNNQNTNFIKDRRRFY